ncbi:MAG: SET domain-containing protein-lysine N-methyltransferase [Gemmatimonadaceae bacterium]|nr:SET domain-containing protein-lysine N-methyltransferase [Gemmatimonadaceae bacterium]
MRTSKIQGKGAFATRRIPKGHRIIEYLGECIDEAESDIRYPDDEMGRHHTFLFSIGDGTRVLDAGPIEWPAKYINHSCDPNCEAIEEEDGRVFISALRNIPKGAELSYDYAYERTAEHTEADEKLYVCRCGSAKCRGTIMAPPKPKKKKKKGAGKKEKKSKKSKQEKQAEQAEKKSKRARRHDTPTPEQGRKTRAE